MIYSVHGTNQLLAIRKGEIYSNDIHWKTSVSGCKSLVILQIVFASSGKTTRVLGCIPKLVSLAQCQKQKFRTENLGFFCARLLFFFFWWENNPQDYSARACHCGGGGCYTATWLMRKVTFARTVMQNEIFSRRVLMHSNSLITFDANRLWQICLKLVD